MSGGLRRLARLLAAAAGAALLALLVIRVSATNALLQLGPEMAAMLAPRHSGVLLGRAHRELRVAGDPSEAAERDALTAFDSAPLSEVPLLVAARRAIARGDGAAADRLLAAALRRNPRSRPALLLALDRQVRAGRSAEAAQTMAVLARLFSEAGQLLVSELARMAADPATRAAVRHAMASDPRLRADVLEALARRGDDAAIFALAGPSAGAEPPRWHGLLVEALVDRGDTARAYQVWRRLAGVGEGAPAAGIYDPGFAGRPGPPPFNWAFETSGDGFAEPSAGALEAEYFGRRDVTLASQLLLLPPGRYQLAFEAEGQAEGQDGRLAWTIACKADGREIGSVPIAGVDFTPGRIAGSFVVPASGCPAQWLRLAGAAAEFPKPQQVRIRGLTLTRRGAP